PSSSRKWCGRTLGHRRGALLADLAVPDLAAESGGPCRDAGGDDRQQQRPHREPERHLAATEDEQTRRDADAQQQRDDGRIERRILVRFERGLRDAGQALDQLLRRLAGQVDRHARDGHQHHETQTDADHVLVAFHDADAEYEHRAEDPDHRHVVEQQVDVYPAYGGYLPSVWTAVYVYVHGGRRTGRAAGRPPAARRTSTCVARAGGSVGECRKTCGVKSAACRGTGTRTAGGASPAATFGAARCTCG